MDIELKNNIEEEKIQEDITENISEKQLVINEQLQEVLEPLKDTYKIDKPGEYLEGAFLKYVIDNFEKASKEDEFTNFLKEQIKERVISGDMSSNQLMTIFLNHETSQNDRLSRLIQPFAQMTIAKQQMETQQAMLQQQQLNVMVEDNDYKAMNSKLTKETIQGLSTLNNLLSVLKENKDLTVEEKSEEN